MAPPLTADGQVTYADGTKADASTRCRRTSPRSSSGPPSPSWRTRHRTGIAVLIFLLFATVLAYLAYRNIWADAKRRREGGETVISH